jgi:hypothetical protein
MLVTAGAVNIFTMDFTAPDKLDTAALEALFLPEYMIGGNLEVKSFMKRMFADKQAFSFEQVFYDFLHNFI